MKKPTLLTSLISLCLLASCTVLMPPLMGGLGAGAGAAVGGPGGAIVGGTAGAATGRVLFPPEEPPAPPAATRPAHFSATVRALIHAPRGEVAGAVLDDGSLLRFPPHGNEALAALLQPDQPGEVWGQALRRAGMQVVRVEHLAAG